MKEIQHALTWAADYLQKENYSILSPATAVREMPWSKVYQFLTSQGIIYLKQMAPSFSIETTVLSILSNIPCKNIPKMIASNNELRCFLMFDAGDVLRPKLKIDYQVSLVQAILRIYSKIQIHSVKNVSGFLEEKVQDWRLNKLPDLYVQLMDSEGMLVSDGLEPDEIYLLRSFYKPFVMLCENLYHYPIPQTIEHGDFHDNNILILNQNIIINDWGDATISHPFFPLASWLNSASRHHGINEEDPKYAIIRDAYLENWEHYASRRELLEAFTLVNKLRPIHFCLNFKRVKQCEGIENFTQYKGYIAEALREFIVIMGNHKHV